MVDTKICLNCGKRFDKPKWTTQLNWKNRKYCSVECSSSCIQRKEKISQNNAKYWLGKKRSEETKRKISKIHKGKKRKPPSEETRRKISLGNKGKKLSKEAIEKMRITKTGVKSKRKYKSYEEQYGKEKANEIKLKMRNAKLGKKSNRVDYSVTQEIKLLLSKIAKDKIQNEEGYKDKLNNYLVKANKKNKEKYNNRKKKFRQIISEEEEKVMKNFLYFIRKMESRERKIGTKNSPEMRKKISKSLKKLWQNQEYRDKMLTKENIKHRMKFLSKKPNKPETVLINLMEQYNLPYVYNGKKLDLILGGKIPDFYNNNGSKQVLELFGRQFHDPNNTFLKEIPYKRTEKGTLEHYENLHYKCLIIWEEELRDMDKVLDKIMLFEKGVQV